MTHAAMLFLALVLDAIFGEPDWLWKRVTHPAILMGNLVNWTDRHFNAASNRKTKGIVVVTVLTVGAWTLGMVFSELPFGALLETVAAAVLLAQRSLVSHVAAVADGLRQSPASGRQAIARIVSRDTSDMNEPAMARSAIESAAENLSDGVIAPAFWFLVFGLPGMLVYKVINTADSMIGYRTPRHEEFGWAAARFDDVLNWIPARLTAALIATSHLRFDIWPAIRRDAALHKSPNAGWPEAAIAPILGVALAGPRSYGGQITDFPFVNAAGRRDANVRDIELAIGVLWRVWVLTLGLIALVAVA